MLELESINAMYSPSDNLPIQNVKEWRIQASKRLEEWYSVTQHSPNRALARTIQFHDIIYYFLLFRLNRPSPGIPFPDHQMRQQSIKAALKLVDVYAHVAKQGLLFYLWHAAHHMLELGVFFLQFILGATRKYTPATIFSAEKFDPKTLIDAMETNISLFARVASRWPETEASVRSLESVTRPVLVVFGHWQRGSRPAGDSLDSKVRDSLTHLAKMVNLPNEQPFHDVSEQPGPQNTTSQESLYPSPNIGVETYRWSKYAIQNVYSPERPALIGETQPGFMYATTEGIPNNGNTGPLMGASSSHDASNDIWDLSSEQLEELFASLDQFSEDFLLAA
ncbi:hypothetical protein A1O1_04551 [Capronia coronata CBS 617.96]|uniref:Transcription factor domain-containing protein n=1 Tax=Capronia coronata CBS 617.96 TaxID=1182541 RepID=W9ZA98_9EURO|nr:uncharacterized protein A1O1_04551 [Capronia coronata CBS 617.96]EXJ91439.1 hypothetical protein A1O1_04551 [Capronia coronata CBS 617.96]